MAEPWPMSYGGQRQTTSRIGVPMDDFVDSLPRYNLKLIPLNEYLASTGLFIDEDSVTVVAPVAHFTDLSAPFSMYRTNVASARDDKTPALSAKTVVNNLSSLVCDVCGIAEQTREALAIHRRSPAHIKKQRALDCAISGGLNLRAWSCEVCPHVEIIDPAGVSSHLNGKKHRNQLKRKAGELLTAPTLGLRTCQLCSVNVSGEVGWKNHLEGKRHNKQLMAGRPESKRLRTMLDLDS
eukprot:CAMPEP_0184679342 /NCGR_PEP_ID=MMETSP0312-20130426/2182_1 /TAXON_ID=31354 /ORGANISM="Compsopogon coeruleus, Strain SAG 36.94" /LENGTH=237 /DNA_ID=CAMNT_0027128733 /DNA_START=22 /DNA_END=735 /DNA_ORIENTATION=+